MGVFTVAHSLSKFVLGVESIWEATLFAFAVHGAKIVGDHAVVHGCVFKCFHGQLVACCKAGCTIVLHHFINDALVVASIDNDIDKLMVFGARAYHRGSANIDIFNRVWQAAIWLGNGLGEGV